MEIFLEKFFGGVSKKTQTANLSSIPPDQSCKPIGISQADWCYLPQSNHLSKLLHFHAVHTTKLRNLYLTF